MKKLIAVFSIIAFSAGLSACNTMKGMGRDIERGGEKLQNSASGSSSSSTSGSSTGTTDKDKVK